MEEGKKCKISLKMYILNAAFIADKNWFSTCAILHFLVFFVEIHLLHSRFPTDIKINKCCLAFNKMKLSFKIEITDFKFTL